MASALYDRIGQGYNSTRRPDPTIFAALANAVRCGPGQRLLDAACGTGNYTLALQHRGASVSGVDASGLMLAAARARSSTIAWVQARVEWLPFVSASFDTITCVNAVHHFGDVEQAFAEFQRILKPGGRLAIFTNTAEQVLAFWVARYFPRAVAEAAARCIPETRFARLGEQSGLALADRLAWQQPRDPVDLFLYCGKHRPELYLDPAIRAGISTFASASDPAEIEQGVARLRQDIASGAIAETVQQAARRKEDYSIFVYERAV
jgi:SAM-dependent methyltransferase